MCEHMKASVTISERHPALKCRSTLNGFSQSSLVVIGFNDNGADSLCNLHKKCPRLCSVSDLQM